MPFKSTKLPRGRAHRRPPAMTASIRMVGPAATRKPAAFVTLGEEILQKLKLKDQTPVEILVGTGRDLGKVRFVFGSSDFSVLARKEAPHSPTMVVGSILIPVGDADSSRKAEPVEYEIVDAKTLEFSLPWKVKPEHVED